MKKLLILTIIVVVGFTVINNLNCDGSDHAEVLTVYETSSMLRLAPPWGGIAVNDFGEEVFFRSYKNVAPGDIIYNKGCNYININ
ncbi:hypothetical protein HN682_08210 [Candidatus Peregrinibacteria bacterium]|jgi:hypothetical protein|nr:hypothetical protein [Candidatus Peregrinibacteria bacterium]